MLRSTSSRPKAYVDVTDRTKGLNGASLNVFFGDSLNQKTWFFLGFENGYEYSDTAAPLNITFHQLYQTAYGYHGLGVGFDWGVHNLVYNF